MADSETEFAFADREQELDLLQRRLHNKTQRAARVIQFNIVALSLAAAVINTATSNPSELNGLLYLGSTIILGSIALAVVGIALGETPLSGLEDDTNAPNVGHLVDEYRDRTRQLGRLVPPALATGGIGAAIILIGAVKLSEIQPGIPWWMSVPIVIAVLVWACAWGTRHARREKERE